MRTPRIAQAERLLGRLIQSAVLPLGVAYLVVTFLADPAHINTGDLQQNSLLMNTRPFFRGATGDVLALSLASSGVLFLTAVLGAILLGVPAGILYGWSTRSVKKTLVWSASTLAVSLPAFFWAVALELLMILVYFHTEWRFLPIAGFGLDEHLVLPSIALGARPAAYIFRLTATAVEDIRHTDYMRTAIAKGLGERALLARHVLPNAAPSIIAATLLGARGALSSLVIVEFVYVWGGAALIFVQALGNRRLELATGIALTFAVASILLTLGAEFAHSRVRVRA